MAHGTGKPVDRGWLADQIDQYEILQPRYELYAVWLKSVLGLAAEGICASPIVQARPKKLASFAGKCVRNWQTIKRPTEEFTDLCGGRVVLQLLKEVEQASNWVRRCFRIDEANSENKRDQLKPDAFGYLSVHLIVLVDPFKLPEELRDKAVIKRDSKGNPDRAVEPKVPPPPLSPKRLNELRDSIRLKGPKLTRELWDQLAGLRAEVQLRTMVQHAWSDVGHDLIYKSAFQVPANYERQNAKIAALLEEVDEAFTDLVAGVSQLQTNVGAYLNHEETLGEIDQLKAILAHDETNTELAAKLARLQISIGLYTDAIDTAKSHYPTDCCFDLDVCIGRAQCLRGRSGTKPKEVEKGRSVLACVRRHQPNHLEAATFLAESYVGIDDATALKLFECAFRIDPNDPAVLGGYLRHRIADDKNPMFASIVQPNIEAAISRCQAQIDVHVNLPYALYRMAEFYLLMCTAEKDGGGGVDLGRPGTVPCCNHGNLDETPYEGLYALCRAISLTTDLAVLEAERDKMDLLCKTIGSSLPPIRWALLTLELAVAYHPDSKKPKVSLRHKADKIIAEDCVLIIAGGCDDREDIGVKENRNILKAVLDEFAQVAPPDRKGIVMGGGTEHGISKVVGKLCAARADRLRAIGYVPDLTPSDIIQSKNYDVFKTDGAGFTALEPLQAWADLLAAGVQARDVKLVGVNGGRIAAFEYHLAAALAAVNALPPTDGERAGAPVTPQPGGQVAIVRKSGRAADLLMLAGDAAGNEYIRFLPADVESFRAFVNYRQTSRLDLTEEQLQTIKGECGRVYNETMKAIRQNRRQKEIDRDEALKQAFDQSTLEQAMHIESKLRRIGKQAVYVGCGNVDICDLSDKEVELLAEMEHGRWVAERTMRGWKFGPEPDDKKRIRPQLVRWKDLDDDEKEKDLSHADAIPEILAKIGFEIQDLDDESTGT